MTDENRVLSLGFFYSNRATKMADAIKAKLDPVPVDENDKPRPLPDGAKPHIHLVDWRKGFFGDEKRSFLDEFYRKIHSLDGAILLLTPDAEIAKKSGAWMWPGRKPLVLNDNVLMEVGACIAKFGKGRTFIVVPDNDSVRLPTYFTDFPKGDKAPMRTYKCSVGNDDKVNAQLAKNIRYALRELGDAAFFSDLPSYGLAHGYTMNFLAQLPELLSDITPNEKFPNGKRKTIVRPTQATRQRFALPESIQYDDFAINIFLPSDQIFSRQEVKEKVDSLECGEFVIEVPNGRAITVFGTIKDLENGLFRIFDVPSNLTPSEKAISFIEQTWFLHDKEDANYKQKLTEKEITNFRRYLPLLIENDTPWLNEDQKSRIRIDYIASLDALAVHI